MKCVLYWLYCAINSISHTHLIAYNSPTQYDRNENEQLLSLSAKKLYFHLWIVSNETCFCSYHRMSLGLWTLSNHTIYEYIFYLFLNILYFNFSKLNPEFLQKIACFHEMSYYVLIALFLVGNIFTIEINETVPEELQLIFVHTVRYYIENIPSTVK